MKHVLIVDDLEENRYLLQSLLQGNGYRVTAVCDGIEALTAARREPPDVIVSDALMPNMDGFSLCRAWMQDPVLQTIPFVFYSATYTSADDEKLALALGAVRYLIKPQEPEHFIQELNAVLQELAARRSPGPLSPLDETVFHALHDATLSRKLLDKITQLEAANRSLLESEERYRTAFRTSPDAVNINRLTDGLYLDINQGFTRLTGWTREEVLGKTSQEINIWRDFGDRQRLVQTLQREGFCENLEADFVTKNGEVLTAQMSASIMTFGGMSCILSITRDLTERKVAEKLRRASEQLAQGVMNSVKSSIAVLDRDGFIISLNESWRRFAMENGIEPGIAAQRTDIGTNYLAICDANAGHELNDARCAHDGIRDVLSGRTSSYELEYPCHSPDKQRWFLMSVTPLEQEGRGVVVAHTDITERKLAEEAQRIAAIAFESQQGMFITDANNVIVRVNKAFTKIAGYTAEEAVGQTPSLFKSGRQDAAFYAVMWDSIQRSGTWQGEIWNRRKNGTVYPEHLSISTVKDDAGLPTHYVGAFTDIASQKAAEEQIHDLAYTDLLTGLPNRVSLIVRLQQAIMAAEKENQRGALLLIDLDNFRTINDSMGHELGDEMLKRIAKRLSALVRREGDTVARLGGDEFALILDRLSLDPQTALRQTETVTHKILEALSQPYQFAHSQVSCTASIGIAFLGENDEKTLEPLKRAELAMFQAKSAGRNTSRFFDPQMQAVVNTRVALEAALREAIQNQQFTLCYQAQVSDSDGIVGVEALLRWNDPKRGMIPPAEFIPLAEETGLILPIGNWVLEAACQQLVLWAVQPERQHLSIAVNVSARQFRESNFVAQVLATLERTGANANRLKLELTESVLIADAEDVIVKMNTLKAIGVGFVIDDFGTGYSSLSYLKRLPLDRLKIDQGFVRNILMDADDAAISQAVIAMATSMGLGVIAEGVETEAQRDLLASMGCHTFQGYLYSRPVPVAEFERLAQRA